MKTLLLAENWPPRQGGIENYLYNIGKHLPAKSVTVVAPLLFLEEEKESIETNRGIDQVIRKKFFWFVIRPSWLPLFIFLFSYLKKNPVNVVIAGKALFEGLTAFYLKKYLGIPYIVCTYAMEIETWSASPINRKKLMRVLEHASRILYINEHTKKSLLQLGATEQQLVKVWPGITVAAFDEIPSDKKTEALSTYSISKPYIISVGRLVPRKGHNLLIQAFAKISKQYPEISLVIVGNGPEEEQLRDVITNLSIEDKVKILTKIADEDLRALYSNAEFFALTPTEEAGDIEGFGIVYLEAAAASLASLGTFTGGVPEAVTHKETGILVKPGSVEAIAEGLTVLLKEKEQTKELGKKGKERAWHEFRWNKRILLVKGVLDAVQTEVIRQKKSSHL